MTRYCSFFVPITSILVMLVLLLPSARLQTLLLTGILQQHSTYPQLFQIHLSRIKVCDGKSSLINCFPINGDFHLLGDVNSFKFSWQLFGVKVDQDIVHFQGWPKYWLKNKLVDCFI